MDTFSVSLSIGTFYIPKKKILFLCFLVGLMHFLMPIIGAFLGSKIINYLHINVHFLLGIILLLICIEMIIDLFKKDLKKFNLNIVNSFLISTSVSLDSFSTGLGLSAITSNYVLSGVIFSICAASFTFIGYLIGKYSGEKLGIYANVLGIILLFVIAILHIFK